MSWHHQLQNKLVSASVAAIKIKEWQNQGNQVVFTNGCFDILHPGHVDYLAKTADLGNKFVLGLNSDASVRRQGKGNDRPIVDELSRAKVLAGLGFIDLIVVFDEDTPFELLTAIQPDVLTKGGDYDANETDTSKKTYVVGSDIVRDRGGKVEIIDFVPGYSTTKLVEKIKQFN